MVNPFVSVIIPNYNHATHLEQRIRSVLNQTYQKFEIIILDDCSNDGSQEIINGFKGHPKIVRIEFNNINSGSPFSQWQKGLALAGGDWIWFAESDDYADYNFLSEMISTIGKHQNVGLAYCDSKIVEGNKVSSETFASIKNKRYKTDRWSHDYFNQGGHEIENYLLPGGTINNSSAVLFSIPILKKVNPFDLGLRYIGDKYAFIKVLSMSGVVYNKKGLNYYRNPFNLKRQDQYLSYFYEQFLVFDWVFRNLKISYRKKFYDAFYANTQNAVFREWTQQKRQIYKKLFLINSKLMIKSIISNFLRSTKKILIPKT